MLGEIVSFVLETPRKSTSLVSDECVVLSVLPTEQGNSFSTGISESDDLSHGGSE